MAHDSAYATSSLGDSLICVWIGEPTVPRVNALADELRALSERNKGRIFLYNLITESTPVPSAEARAALQADFASMRGKLLGAAMVLEKLGVEGSVSRAVLTTLITITRQPFPMRVFSVRRDGATWLGKQGSATTANAFVAQAETLERRLRLMSAEPPAFSGDAK